MVDEPGDGPDDEVPDAFCVLRLAPELRRSIALRCEQVHDRMGELDDDPFASLVAAPVERPTDPALLRLLPDAVGTPGSDDPFDRLASDDRRSVTDHDLRARKISDAEHVQGQLRQPGPYVALSERDVETWVRATNDARLLLSADLGITATRGAGKVLRDLALRPSEAKAALVALGDLQLLGELQDALLEALDPGLSDAVTDLVQRRPWEDS